MTSSAVETPQRLAPRVTGRWTRLAVAAVLGGAGVASTFVPALKSGELRWLPFALVIPIVAWCAWPIHRAAARGAMAAQPTPDVLATAGILAAVAWSFHAIIAEHSSAHLVPIVVATVLMVAADAVSSGSDAEPYDSSPRWLTPLVLAVSAGTLTAWWIADGASAAALSVLLIASPAALRIAGPAAKLTSVRRGAEAGIVLNGPQTLEVSQRINAIVLDKNGTVTTGELSVLSVDPVEPEHLRNLRWFAGALAHRSDHPVGRAIAKLSGRGHVAQVVDHDGEGMSGSVDRHPVRLGRPPWIGIPASGGLGVETVVEVDGRILGRITVGDTIRADAKESVAQLRTLGLDPLLVSDLADADTAHLAEQSGITKCRARSTAHDRELLIGKLQTDGQIVAMVGNREANAAALDAADLAITPMSDSPSRGIGLAEIDVRSVHDAIILARATLSTASTNRRWAVAGMLAPVPFAAAGLIAPMYAPLFALLCMIGIGFSSSRIPRVGRLNR